MIILKHKVIMAVVLLGLLAGGYGLRNSLISTPRETRYVLGLAQKETIIDSVSGTGQIMASNQIDLSSKISGTITQLSTPEGSMVKAGQIIARLDSTIAQKVVRDAEANLDSAKVALRKIELPADQLSLTQSQNALDRAIDAKQTAKENLNKAYSDSHNAIANAFLDLPTIMSGLYDILYTTNEQLGGVNVNNINYYGSTASIFDARGSSYGADADKKYQVALVKFNKSLIAYNSISRSADSASVEAMLLETQNAAIALSETVLSVNNLIQFYKNQMVQHGQNIPSPVALHLSMLNTYTGTTNIHLTSILSLQNAISTNKNTLIDSDRTINERTQSLARLNAGTIPLDKEAAEIIVRQRENALLDAQQVLADYTIRAPFGGTLAKINVKTFGIVSTGIAIATLVTKQQVAKVVLNEVAAAKVKIGDKATLTFDALDAFTQTGTVADIDTVGTVSQGVVSYAVKIILDSQDEQVKLGMSTSAVIITRKAENVLSVPNSAVRTRGDIRYVEVFDIPLEVASDGQGALSPTLPIERLVEVGLSDEVNTEILSGVKEGSQIVILTITPDTAQSGDGATVPSIIPTGGGVP